MLKKVFGFLFYFLGAIFILSGFLNLPHLGIFLTGILMSLPLFFLGNKLLPFKINLTNDIPIIKEKNIVQKS